MYKKVWCTCKVVVLLIKPIVFLTFSLSSASLDLKVPITSHSPKFQICPLGSHRNFACVKTPLFKPFQKWPNMVNFTTENKTYCFRVWSAFLDTNGDVFSSTHSICNYNLVPWWRRQRKQIMNSRSFNRDYYSFKIFLRFWLAKRTRLIHHNQLLLTKLGRILCLARKWRQKCSVLAG